MATEVNSTALGRDAMANGIASTAVGASAMATFGFSTAVGQGSLAIADSSTALGSNTQASGANSVAVGTSAVAFGENSTSIGQDSQAGGKDSIAIGQQSSASGINSTALGQNAKASAGTSTALGSNTGTGAFTNSTAVGFGSTTTRNDQMMFGTASNTYTAPGITSASSRAAQSGPRQIVTSDSGGNLATDTAAGLGLATTADTMMLRGDIDRANEGVAMAMAMSGIPNVLPNDATYGISANWGTFGGENAMALGGALTVTDSLFFSGGGAIGSGNNGTSGGARAGFTFIR